MIKKSVILLISAVIMLFAGCGNAPEAAKSSDPESVVTAYMEASQKGDLETLLSLVSDNVVLTQDPPGIKIEGKTQYEASVRENARWNPQYFDLTPYRVDGAKVTFSLKAADDSMLIRGIEYITTHFEITVQNGRISSLKASPDSSDWARIVEAGRGVIGINISTTEKGLKVEGFAVNSPAPPAGLHPGDIITAVDGMKYSQMRTGEMQLRISGKVGTKVVLTVIREDSSDPFDIEITRVDMTQLTWTHN